MRRLQRTLPGLLATLALLLLLPGTARSDPEPEVPETAPADAPADAPVVPVIDAVTRATPRYLPITWRPHDAHAGRAGGNCRKCHHDLRGDATAPRSCAACHDDPEAEMDLVEVYHELCRNCHRARQESGKRHGPLKCLGCHTERP